MLGKPVIFLLLRIMAILRRGPKKGKEKKKKPDPISPTAEALQHPVINRLGTGVGFVLVFWERVLLC